MTTSQRPTSIRYIILTLTVVVAVLLYLDRFCLGFVLNYIKENYRLSEGETRFLVSAFFYTYAIGQIPGGWLADRYGARLMLALFLASWSVLTGLMGFAQGFVMLLLLRFGCGLFEAGAYPACAGLIRRWIPYEQRGLASGIISLGGRIGGTIAPVMTAQLMLIFMPLSTSSLVTDHDLLNERKLARDVYFALTSEPPPAEPIASSIGRHLHARIPAAVVQDFQSVTSLEKKETLTPVQQSAMVTTVNSWLTQADLFDQIDLTPIKTKLNKQATQLLQADSSSLTQDEITRRNRLVLEVVFPESIRKLEGDSWQPVLMIYGTIGVLLAVFFWSFFRDSPRQHFLTNEAEAQLVEAHETASPSPAPPMREIAYGMLTNVGLWASAIVQFGMSFVWIFLSNEMAMYLSRVYQVPIELRGWMTFLPFFVSLPMLIVGGWWTDWLTKKYGPRFGRSFPLASTRFMGAAAPLLACCHLDSAWQITVALCIFAVTSDMGLPAIWAYNLDVGGRNVGLILGWGNMIGNLGAAVSATVFGYILKMYVNFDGTWTIDEAKAGYRAVFLTGAAVFVFIGVVAMFVDASKPVGIKPAPKRREDDI